MVNGNFSRFYQFCRVASNYAGSPISAYPWLHPLNCKNITCNQVINLDPLARNLTGYCILKAHLPSMD